MHIPEYFEFFNKTKICSGLKSLENIPFDLGGMDASRPLVITDPDTVRKGYGKVLIKSFYDSGMTIGAFFDQVHGAPLKSMLKEVAALYRDRGCDSIIALGGAASVSAAKAVNI